MEEKIVMDKILTINEVAKLLRVPLSTAQKLASKRDVDFPRSFKVGRHRRWVTETVLRFLEGDPAARA